MVLPKSYGIAAGWPLAPGQVPGFTPAPPPPNLLRVVGTAGEVNYLFTGSAVTTGTAIHEHRTRAFIGPGGVKAGTARISNHAFRGLPGSEPDAPGYLVRSHIEYNGVAYVSTYGGAAKGTVAAGGVDVQSDPHTGCPDIPAGALVWIVRRREYAVGVTPHYLYNATFSPVISGQGYNRGDGSGATAIGVAGPMPGGTGWTAIDSLYAPPVLLGEPITPSAARPFIICGASIEYANNDATGDGANGAGAYMRRALADGGGTKYPWINMAVGSESSVQFIAASTRRRAYLQYAAGGCAVNGYGGNDFTGGATPDDTWANFLTINGYFKAAGITRTAVVRAHVKSNSTDNYATTTNQTPRGNFPSWRASMDAKAAASLADGTIGLYLDDSAAIEASGNIWKAPGYTTDGTHPEKIGHDAMYPIIRQQLANGGFL